MLNFQFNPEPLPSESSYPIKKHPIHPPKKAQASQSAARFYAALKAVAESSRSAHSAVTPTESNRNLALPPLYLGDRLNNFVASSALSDKTLPVFVSEVESFFDYVISDTLISPVSAVAQSDASPASDPALGLVYWAGEDALGPASDFFPGFFPLPGTESGSSKLDSLITPHSPVEQASATLSFAVLRFSSFEIKQIDVNSPLTRRVNLPQNQRPIQASAFTLLGAFALTKDLEGLSELLRSTAVEPTLAAHNQGLGLLSQLWGHLLQGSTKSEKPKNSVADNVLLQDFAALVPEVPVLNVPAPVLSANPEVPVLNAPAPVLSANPEVPVLNAPAPVVSANPEAPVLNAPAPVVSANPEVPVLNAPAPVLSANPEAPIVAVPTLVSPLFAQQLMTFAPRFDVESKKNSGLPIFKLESPRFGFARSRNPLNSLVGRFAEPAKDLAVLVNTPVLNIEALPALDAFFSGLFQSFVFAGLTPEHPQESGLEAKVAELESGGEPVFAQTLTKESELSSFVVPDANSVSFAPISTVPRSDSEPAKTELGELGLNTQTVVAPVLSSESFSQEGFSDSNRQSADESDFVAPLSIVDSPKVTPFVALTESDALEPAQTVEPLALLSLSLGVLQIQTGVEKFERKFVPPLLLNRLGLGKIQTLPRQAEFAVVPDYAALSLDAQLLYSSLTQAKPLRATAKAAKPPVEPVPKTQAQSTPPGAFASLLAPALKPSVQQYSVRADASAGLSFASTNENGLNAPLVKTQSLTQMVRQIQNLAALEGVESVRILAPQSQTQSTAPRERTPAQDTVAPRDYVPKERSAPATMSTVTQAPISASQVIQAINHNVPVHIADFPAFINQMIQSHPPSARVIQSLQVSLMPDQLGQVTAQFSLTADNKMVITLYTQALATMETLETYLGEIQKIVGKTQLSLGNISVKQAIPPSRQSQGSGGSGFDEGNGDSSARHSRRSSQRRRGGGDEEIAIDVSV